MLDYERINILGGVCMVSLTFFEALFDGLSVSVLLFSYSNIKAEILIVQGKLVLPLNLDLDLDMSLVIAYNGSFNSKVSLTLS